MRIDILTVLPEMIEGMVNCSIVKRAQDKGLAEIHLHNLRDYTTNKWRRVDDYPFGGEAGMVMQIEPIDRAISALKSEREYDEVIYTSPDGETLQPADGKQHVDAEQSDYPLRALQRNRLPHPRTSDNKGNIRRRLCPDRR